MAELLVEFSSSGYLTDTHLSRFTRILQKYAESNRRVKAHQYVPINPAIVLRIYDKKRL
jgi:hypothetical protein